MERMFKFTVEGRREFPFDMLRYDSCWPPKNGGTDNIANLAPHEHTARYSVNRRVNLIGLHEPTEARWATMGWHVVPGSVEKSEYVWNVKP